jgi:hypothetical protein
MIAFRKVSWWAAALMPTVIALGCSSDGLAGLDDAPSGASRAFGIWSPTPAFDTCTQEVHNSFAVVGTDGKLYPTWHPPIDPQSGCTIGHDHGRDPSGSDLFGEVGPIPFGYANEVLDAHDPANPRHEDHFGHKVEWENDLEMNTGSAIFQISCDVLIKMHQGTHSKDALTNNLHELVFHTRCSDGTELHVTFLTNIGDAGGFESTCDDLRVEVGPPSPVNSPDGGGRRIIPARSCVDQLILVPDGGESQFRSALRESWQLGESIRAENGRRLASLGPYFNVALPSRFHDPATPGIIGRPMEVCYEVTPTGEQARGGHCEEATAGGTILDITWDDPRSPFDGADRDVDINTIRITNTDGPEVWYTDPFGANGRTEPFQGSIRQWIARIDNEAVPPNGPRIGRDYGGPGTGVHAPN